MPSSNASESEEYSDFEVGDGTVSRVKDPVGVVRELLDEDAEEDDDDGEE